MTVKHQQSTAITNLQTVPVVPNPTGAGAEGYMKTVDGYVTVAASQDVDSTIRFCQVPSNAKIKSVVIQSQAQTQAAVDVGLYYPTDGLTGKADLAANAIDQDFFASAVSLNSAVQPTGITNESGTYTADLQDQPIWKAVGLSTDPGGFFDIVGTVTTAVTTGTGIAGVRVDFVM
jgi:hypothetical protein